MPSKWRARRAMPRSSRTARGKPRTRLSPTWPWPPPRGRSRPAPRRAPTASPNTTSSCGSSRTWGPQRVFPDAAPWRPKSTDRESTWRLRSPLEFHFPGIAVGTQESVYEGCLAVQSPQPLVRVSLRGAAVRMRSKEPEMKTPQAGALSVAIFALAAVAPAGESWRVKPSTEWNEKDVREILEKSPWAHREKLIVAREQAEVPPVESPDSHSTGSNVPIEPTTPGTRRRPTPSP